MGRKAASAGAELPTLEAFQGSLETPFQVHVDDSRTVEVTLLEVACRERPGWESFSLLFGSPDQPFPPATYATEHERLGTFDLFLVPVLSDAPGYRYESVFNRPRH